MKIIEVVAFALLLHLCKAQEKIDGDDVQMEEGESTVLQCSVSGGEIAKWLRNDKELKSDSKKYEIWKNNNTLVILKSSYEDVGPYECQFDSDKGTFSKTVNVTASPFVKHFDRSKNLVQGDNLLLECKAFGFPPVHVKWFKGEEAVEEGGRVKLDDLKGVEDGVLRINDLTFDDRADYTCEASNMLGSHNSTIVVRVKDKLAALWPFLGICAEVAILCLIIFIYERRRAKKLEEEEMQENATHDMTNSNDHKGKDEVRQRK